jgi:DNA-directed RNA polymerase specialized sigma24 family protein
MHLSRVEEKDLVAKIREYTRAGNMAARDEAAAELYGLYRTPIRRRALFLADSVEDADEILSIAWARFLEEYDPSKSSVTTFMWRLLKNATSTFYGRRHRGESLTEFLDGDREDEQATSWGLPHPDPGPEAFLLRTQAYEELLRAAFQNDSPTHQRITFGFNRLLEWKPQEITAQLSPQLLLRLALTLTTDYAQVSSFPQLRVLDLMAPLHADLKMKNSTFMRDEKTRRTWKHLLDSVAAGTVLQQYYSGKDEAAKCQNINAWSDTIRRKIVSRLARTAGRGSIKLEKAGANRG